MKYKFINEKGEHLHEIDGKPLIGTSTVLSVLSKPLTWWAAGLAVKELGWLNPKEFDSEERLETAKHKLNEISGMSVDEFLELLDKGYRAHSVKLDKSANQGTDMHEELENYIKASIAEGGVKHPDVETSKEVFIFSEWAYSNVKRFLVSEGHCYSEKLWCGGITDCIAELKDGNLAIIDFKSAKEAYTSHFIQVSGYDIEASENGLFDDKGNQTLKLDKPISCYIVFAFGAKKVEPKIEYDTEKFKIGFESCLQLYKLINNK